MFEPNIREVVAISVRQRLWRLPGNYGQADCRHLLALDMENDLVREMNSVHHADKEGFINHLSVALEARCGHARRAFEESSAWSMGGGAA